MDFIASFESKVKRTIKDYNLLSGKDKVVVACSGGKDSTVVLYLLHKWGFDVEALTIDLHIGDWSTRNLENIRSFCSQYNIKLNVYDLREEMGSSICFIRSNVQSRTKLNNCTVCGILKKWILNKCSRELGAAKLATGHNLDDGAEMVMMNLIKGNPELGLNMGPISRNTVDKKFVPRIRPLFFVLNDDVKKYSKLKGFPVLFEPCPYSVNAFRRDIRNRLNELGKSDPGVKLNIVSYFFDKLPKLRKLYKTDNKISYCELCGEPSRNRICSKCNLFRGLNKK